MLTPALTTVAAPTVQAGRAAVEALLARLEHPGTAPRAQQLPARLVVRGSTAPPAQSMTNQGAV
jgi:DNA-binding LacI/PurR family transcriptional regulator